MFLNPPKKIVMARPVTLFTGQWADLSLSELAPLAKKMGFDGLELACWGDHFDVYKAAESKEYCQDRWRILSDNGLTAFAISNHLVGQAICDNIDERHQAILPPQVWGNGKPEGVRQRAAENMKTAGRACRNFLDARPGQGSTFPAVVIGFSGSSIWHACYAFPPTSQEFLQRGFDDFGERFLPILEEFDQLDDRRPALCGCHARDNLRGGEKIDQRHGKVGAMLTGRKSLASGTMIDQFGGSIGRVSLSPNPAQSEAFSIVRDALFLREYVASERAGAANSGVARASAWRDAPARRRHAHRECAQACGLAPGDGW